MPQRSSVLARKIGAFVQLSETELEYLSGLHSTPVEVKRGAEIVHEGQISSSRDGRAASNFYPTILWAASRDEALVVEHLVSVGRRTPAGRTAHFLLELYDRLHLVGLAADNEFACPLNQYVLSDALGLSTIHVNRVLRELREKGLVTFKAHKVVIHDAARLKALAGYESPDVGQVVIGETRPREQR
jgi:hypothetical protein